jgi:ATP phosphoribosyltransferase
VSARKAARKRSARLRLGLPKGSLQNTTAKLFELAGYNLRFPERSYYPEIDDPEIECILIRAQEMARYVEQGVLDAGITGIDWVRENGAKVKELADLAAPWPNYRPVRWLLAVKEGSSFQSVSDLRGKRIATEVVNITKAYLRQHGVRAEVEFSYGATEVKPPILADAIVDVSETGSSIRANRLRVLDTVLESTPRFIAKQGRAGRAVEEAEVRAHAADAPGRDRRGRARGPDDERAEARAAARARGAAGARHAHHLGAGRRPVDRGEHGGRGEGRARAAADAGRARRARHRGVSAREDRGMTRAARKRRAQRGEAERSLDDSSLAGCPARKSRGAAPRVERRWAAPSYC